MLFSNKYIHIGVQPISRNFQSHKTETLYPLNNNSSFLLLQPLAITILHSVSIHWILYIFHISRITQYLSFCDWLISLSMIYARIPLLSATPNPHTLEVIYPCFEFNSRPSFLFCYLQHYHSFNCTFSSSLLSTRFPVSYSSLEFWVFIAQSLFQNRNSINIDSKWINQWLSW